MAFEWIKGPVVVVSEKPLPSLYDSIFLLRTWMNWGRMPSWTKILLGETQVWPDDRSFEANVPYVRSVV